MMKSKSPMVRVIVISIPTPGSSSSSGASIGFIQLGFSDGSVAVSFTGS